MQAGKTGDKEAHPYHRRYVRHKVRLKVEVKVNEAFHSWTNNLSEDGVCFEIPRRLPVGREVVVWVYIKGGEPVESRCRVVWHDKGKKDTRHGAQFVGFVDDGLDRLRLFLAELNRPITQPPPP
jgi:hypothetical protein